MEAAAAAPTLNQREGSWTQGTPVFRGVDGVVCVTCVMCQCVTCVTCVMCDVDSMCVRDKRQETTAAAAPTAGAAGRVRGQRNHKHTSSSQREANLYAELPNIHTHLSHAWHHCRQAHVEDVCQAGQSCCLGCRVDIQQTRQQLLANLVPGGVIFESMIV